MDEDFKQFTKSQERFLQQFSIMISNINDLVARIKLLDETIENEFYTNKRIEQKIDTILDHLNNKEVKL